MARQYIKHQVEDMDESMIQKCTVCGAMISDYRNVMCAEGDRVVNGFGAGEVYVSKGNPVITTKILGENETAIDCKTSLN